MLGITFLWALLLLVVADVQCCKYDRFSSIHTYCLPKNFSCNILDHGVTFEERQHILKLHNDYRSKIATGQEPLGGGMPSAANMLELVWDDELAEVAQSLTKSCRYGHDCHSCRMVPRFLVGQNIGRIPGGPNLKHPDWDHMTKLFYDEVEYFNRNIVSRYVENTRGKKYQYGHLTQMLWAKTWRIGCGWTLYEENGIRKGYYACNFGPAGNVLDEEVYKEGPPCSACPSNTCCGQSCARFGLFAQYPGLCKVINENFPPEGNAPHLKFPNELFYCNFNNEPDCAATVEGTNAWRVSRSNGGSWNGIVLYGGQSSTLHFQNPIRTSSGNFCFTFVTRRGPDVANTTYSNQFFTVFQFGQRVRNLQVNVPSVSRRHMFITSQYPMRNYPRNTDINYSAKFVVPPGSPPQFLEIQKVVATEGECPMNWK